MVERSFAEAIKAVGEALPKDLSKPRWNRRDFWLVLTGGVLGAIVGGMLAFGFYLLVEMGM